MSLRYSASTGGFYETRIHTQIPEDAVFVSRAAHAALMDAQAAGGHIVASPETGRPVIDAANEDSEAVRSRLIASVKREAERRILAISPLWRQLNDVRNPTSGAVERFDAIDAIRNASNAIEHGILTAETDALGDYSVSESSLWPHAGGEI